MVFKKISTAFLQNGGERLPLTFQNNLFRFVNENLLGTRVSNNLTLIPFALKKVPLQYISKSINSIDKQNIVQTHPLTWILLVLSI